MTSWVAVDRIVGLPQADPIAGFAIGLLIVQIGPDARREVAERLMDVNDTELARRVETVVAAVPGVGQISDVQARWLGRVERLAPPGRSVTK